MKDSGFSVSAIIVSVRRSSRFNEVHAVFFPQPRNREVVSQPVKAWKWGRARDFDGQAGSGLEYFWVVFFLPVLKPILRSLRSSCSKKASNNNVTINGVGVLILSHVPDMRQELDAG